MTIRTAMSCCAAIVMVLCAIDTSAQISVQPGMKMKPLGRDTICFRYDFRAGDSLLYKVEANDSIFFGKTESYVKERVEWFGLICDSVDASGLFHVRQQVLSSIERTKAFPSGDTSWRDASPWMHRTAYLVIDSLGMRKRVAVDDDSKAALTLGGAFQPILLVPLGQSCGRQNESWTTEVTTLLVENGVPEPAFQWQSLMRVIDKADTLGMRFHQIQYTQGGLGRLVMPQNADMSSMTLDGVINAFGKLSIERSRNVPFHLFATSESKITMVIGGRTKEGRHLTSMNYHLMQLGSTDPARRYSALP